MFVAILVEWDNKDIHLNVVNTSKTMSKEKLILDMKAENKKSRDKPFWKKPGFIILVFLAFVLFNLDVKAPPEVFYDELAAKENWLHKQHEDIISFMAYSDSREVFINRKVALWTNYYSRDYNPEKIKELTKHLESKGWQQLDVQDNAKYLMQQASGATDARILYEAKILCQDQAYILLFSHPDLGETYVVKKYGKIGTLIMLGYEYSSPCYKK